MMLLEFFGNFSFMLFLVVENLGFFLRLKKKKRLYSIMEYERKFVIFLSKFFFFYSNIQMFH